MSVKRRTSSAYLTTRPAQDHLRPTIPHIRILRVMAYEDGNIIPTIFFPSSSCIQSTQNPLFQACERHRRRRMHYPVDPQCRALDVGARPTFFRSEGGYQVGEVMGREMVRMKKKAAELAFKSDPPTMGTCVREYPSPPLPRSVDVGGKPFPRILDLMYINHPLECSLSASYLDMNVQPLPTSSGTLYSRTASSS